MEDYEKFYNEIDKRVFLLKPHKRKSLKSIILGSKMQDLMILGLSVTLLVLMSIIAIKSIITNTYPFLMCLLLLPTIVFVLTVVYDLEKTKVRKE